MSCDEHTSKLKILLPYSWQDTMKETSTYLKAARGENMWTSFIADWLQYRWLDVT